MPGPGMQAPIQTGPRAGSRRYIIWTSPPRGNLDADSSYLPWRSQDEVKMTNGRNAKNDTKQTWYNSSPDMCNMPTDHGMHP